MLYFFLANQFMENCLQTFPYSDRKKIICLFLIESVKKHPNSTWVYQSTKTQSNLHKTRKIIYIPLMHVVNSVLQMIHYDTRSVSNSFHPSHDRARSAWNGPWQAFSSLITSLSSLEFFSSDSIDFFCCIGIFKSVFWASAYFPVTECITSR